MRCGTSSSSYLFVMSTELKRVFSLRGVQLAERGGKDSKGETLKIVFIVNGKRQGGGLLWGVNCCVMSRLNLTARLEPFNL